MTARHRRFLAPRRPRTITTYGVHALDNLREEVMPRYHRDASVDDPWLSPGKSEAVRACLIKIEYAANHTPLADVVDVDLDLEVVCQDAGLTARQAEAVLLVGEGWSVGAIARWLGITHQAASLRIHNGRRKLVRQVLPLDTFMAKVLAEGVF